MYTTVQEVENYLELDISKDFEPQIETWIGMATDYIDRETGTTFESEEGAERYYNGNGKRILFIDDFQEITEVKIDPYEKGNWGAAQVRYGGKRPIYKIKKVNGVFPSGMDNILVKGEYGYSKEVPDDIRMATMILASGLINDDGKKMSESVKGFSIKYTDDKGLSDYETARNIIKSYSK